MPADSSKATFANWAYNQDNKYPLHFDLERYKFRIHSRVTDYGSKINIEILTIILAAVVCLLFLTFISRYKRCPSNKILVIYGKTGGGTAAKYIHGGAAFVLPLLQDYEYLDLEPFVVPIDLNNALSQENIRVSVPTAVTAAISNQPGITQNAAIRLLGLSRDKVQSQAQDIILGQMRAVIATMRIEEINQDRQAFMIKVNEAVSTETDEKPEAIEAPAEPESE